MEQTPFGAPPNSGQNTPSNPYQRSHPNPPETFDLEPEPMQDVSTQENQLQPSTSGGQEESQGELPRHPVTEPLSLVAEVDWNAAATKTDDEKEWEEYMRMIDSDKSAISLTPEEYLGQGLQQGVPWGSEASAWGPGINGEMITDALFPLYNDIPSEYRTREYWTTLVEASRSIFAITPQSWVDEMVRRLNLPTITPESLFGWSYLSSDWRLFFLSGQEYFRPGNVTPEVWISMMCSLRSSDPQTWRARQALERGDPAGYISHYMPTIPTPAPPLRLNPAAFGPIPEIFDPRKKATEGLLINCPEYWGDFFDDGPPKEGESETKANLRINMARSNMGIIRRPTEKLPRLEKSARSTIDEKASNERFELSKAIVTKNKRLAAEHNRKMDETHPKFDPIYRDAWRRQQKDRRAENNRRRQAAYEHASRYYRQMHREMPPKPTPPDDSDDDYYFDPPMPSRKHQSDGNGQGSEQFRCKPCADSRARCSYKTKPFPCDRCVNLGITNLCESSKPETAELAIRTSTQTTDTHTRGPFIPSFALPPERLEHHMLPAEWPTKGPKRPEDIPAPSDSRYYLPNIHISTRASLSSAVTPSKRKKEDNDGEDNQPSGPPKKTAMLARKAREAALEALGRGTAPPRNNTKMATGLKRSDGRKMAAGSDAEPPFEACDYCQHIGHPEWCDRPRPCSICIATNRAFKCDASRQNQPYGTSPGVIKDDNTIVVDDQPAVYTGYDYQPIYGPPCDASCPVDPEDAVPYSFLQENIGQLYESRMQLGGLPVRRPRTAAEIVQAFVDQDNMLRLSDPEYRPLIVVPNALAYMQRRLAFLAGQLPQYMDPRLRSSAGPGTESLSLSETLWQEGVPTMAVPQAPVTETDVLRSQVQQPHSSSQDLANFNGALAIRQTNRYDDAANSLYPERALDIANDSLDWVMTDGDAPLESGSGNYDEFFHNVFQDPEDQLDSSLVEPSLPVTLPMAQVTTEDIARALEATSAFIYPLTWSLDDMRKGHDVEAEISGNQKRTAHCTEDLNFWTKDTKPNLCPDPNGIVCDAWTCPNRASCRNCWQTQQAAVLSREMELVAKTKSWLCKPCKADLERERLRPQLPQPRLKTCHCVSQLQETRVCNMDRVNAANAIASRMEEQLALAVQKGWSARCGHCRRNAEDVRSGAWRCICCNQIVTLP